MGSRPAASEMLYGVLVDAKSLKMERAQKKTAYAAVFLFCPMLKAISLPGIF